MDNYTNTEQDNLSLTSAPTPAPKKTGGAAKVIALALCCSLVGGAAGAGGVFALDALKGGSKVATESSKEDSTVLVGSRDNASIKLTSVDTSNELTAAEIYANNVNSTVGITTTVTANYYGYQMEGEAAGSGFILTADGYIVTNYHVVEDSKDIKVSTYDGGTYDAELIGYDENNDIAVLKVNASGLTPVILGDSDQMNVGDNVVAIGNPLGELAFSLTSGSVSALNRKISISNVAMSLIQTDCAINSGNSGGALFNSHGEVIGITNAKYSSSGSSSAASIDNIGFAIPINTVRDIITSIIENGYIEKPYIGVTVMNVQSDSRNTDIKGAIIYEVEEGSPAEKAGLQKDDVITAVNGTAVSSTTELCSILAEGKEGDKYTLTVYRNGETIKVTVKLGVRRQDALPDVQKDEESVQGGQGFSGFPGQGYPYQGDSNQGFPGQGYPDGNGSKPEYSRPEN
ncbi:MAG: trypsin-like peptidase domain-containing protein [Clostridiales bacterium]|nr:trypsin-like peptidase domain-containing protein [Clostridiales bacterium]